jgi:hypothetical protein
MSIPKSAARLGWCGLGELVRSFHDDEDGTGGPLEHDDWPGGTRCLAIIVKRLDSWADKNRATSARLPERYRKAALEVDSIRLLLIVAETPLGPAESFINQVPAAKGTKPEAPGFLANPGKVACGAFRTRRLAAGDDRSNHRKRPPG